MKNKQCPKCGQIKLTTEFFNLKRSKDGLSYQCKDCKMSWNKNNVERSKELSNKSYQSRKHKVKEYQENRKEGYFSIYVLEGLNYVGVTNDVVRRMTEHKWAGRDFSRYTILDTAQTKADALYIEATYHVAGYDGSAPNEEALREQIKNKNI